MNQSKLKKLHGPGCPGCQVNVGVWAAGGRKLAAIEQMARANFIVEFGVRTDAEAQRVSRMRRVQQLNDAKLQAKTRRVGSAR